MTQIWPQNLSLNSNNVNNRFNFISVYLFTIWTLMLRTVSVCLHVWNETIFWENDLCTNFAGKSFLFWMNIFYVIVSFLLTWKICKTEIANKILRHVIFIFVTASLILQSPLCIPEFLKYWPFLCSKTCQACSEQKYQHLPQSQHPLNNQNQGEFLSKTHSRKLERAWLSGLCHCCIEVWCHYPLRCVFHLWSKVNGGWGAPPQHFKKLCEIFSKL